MIDFIRMMNAKFDNFTFVFHATDENKDLINKKINNTSLKNVEVISDENIKKQINDCEETLAKIRSKTSSSDEASSVLTKFLIS